MPRRRSATKAPGVQPYYCYDDYYYYYDDFHYYSYNYHYYYYYDY